MGAFEGGIGILGRDKEGGRKDQRMKLVVTREISRARRVECEMSH